MAKSAPPSSHPKPSTSTEVLDPKTSNRIRALAQLQNRTKNLFDDVFQVIYQEDSIPEDLAEQIAEKYQIFDDDSQLIQKAHLFSGIFPIKAN